MKYYLIYKTTNLINGKIYIGRHSTNNLNDGYIGSGTEFQKALKEFGRKNFEREVLFIYDNWKEMVDKETELLTEEFVDSEETYNSTRQGKGLVTHTDEARQKLREINTGFTTAIDSDGNYHRVSTNDPRYLSGELKYMFSGMVSVKDKDGNKFKVPVDDPRYLSGELVSQNLGIKMPVEKGIKHSKMMKEYWEGKTHTDDSIQKMRDANVGKVTVKDEDGNKFRIDKDDERLKTGELVLAFIGTKLSKTACEKISENKKGCIWISNLTERKTKLVKETELENYLNNGWIKYRILFNKPNSILKYFSSINNK